MFLSVIGAGVGVNLLSSAVEQQPWAWVAPALFALAAVIAVPRSGLLRREPHASARWVRGLLLVALLAYVGVSVWGSEAAWPLHLFILSASCLWGTCVLLTWPILRGHASVGEVAVGVSSLLVGVAALLYGGAALGDGKGLFGVSMLLFGVATPLHGIAVLRHTDRLFGVGMLLLGLGVLLIGFRTSGYWDQLPGVALLLLGVTWLSTARKTSTQVAMLLLEVVIVLLTGVALLTFAVWAFGEGEELFGVVFVLFAFTMLLLGVARLRAREMLFGVASSLCGVAGSLCGVAMWGHGVVLLGLALLLFGVAALLFGLAVLGSRDAHAAATTLGRVRTWLTAQR